MKNLDPKDLNLNAIQAIGSDWMAVCATAQGETNAMTASWGGIGILWNKPVAYVFLRPQRYTKKLVDQAERFTLNFFNGAERDALTHLGKVSRTDTPDKMQQSTLTPVQKEDVIYFSEASHVLIVKPLYQQTMTPGCFKNTDLIETYYPEKDFHDVYVCEIQDVLVQ